MIAVGEAGFDGVQVNDLDALDGTLRDGGAGLCLADITLIELLLAKRLNLPPVIAIDRQPDIDRAVAAIRRGASDYVRTVDADDLADKVRSHFRAALSPDIICASEKSRRCFDLAARVAGTDVAVLVSGASGTGKEVVARHIHACSDRARGPFIAINCAAIPENMLEAILFGHVKGAFTGAQSSQPGKFELAHGGTLLLDEITEMPLGLQAKLLRVLQEREVERLGGRQPVSVDVRVIATTNIDIRAAIDEGRFREDLYYRLSVFPLQLPPLKERPEDIAELAKHFLLKHGSRIGRGNLKLTTQALAALAGHSWPGNVRELENAIQRSLVMCEGDAVTPADLELDERCELAGSGDDRLRDARFEAESDVILRVLRANDGHRKASARELGISERTLRYKVKKMRETGLLEV